MTAVLWGIIFLAAIISLASPFAWRRLLISVGTFDVPNQRSSHSKPVLRGGGVAPLTSILVGGLATIFVVEDSARIYMGLIITAAVIVSLVGLVEDISGVPVRIRAATQILIGTFLSIGLSWAVESRWLLIPLAALVFAANVNFTNFMDGVNGISGLHGLIVGILFATIGEYQDLVWLTFVGLLVAVAYSMFLPWNLISPGMFLGDVGSYLLGGLTGATAIAAVWAGVNPIIAFAPLSIYWVDTISTLARRLLRGEPIFKAHRSHIYQQLTDHRFSHLESALCVTLFTGLAGTAGIVVADGNLLKIAGATTALLLIWFIYLMLPWLTHRRKGQS